VHRRIFFVQARQQVIRSAVQITSVRRGSWDAHSAALLSRAGDPANFAGFDLLCVNADSYALVRNLRGCVYIGAYAGRGVLAFVLHVRRCGYAVLFSTRYWRQAVRVFHGLYSDCVPDFADPARHWFFIPSVI
jgi:hypothetical protein